MVIHITPISGALDSLPVPKPPPKTLGNVEVVLLSGETLALPICQGDGVAELQKRAAEALGLNPCQVALHADGAPLTNDLIRADMSLQLVKMDLSLEGVWNVDISQGYSFVLTVTGKEASFEGGSYGTWSNIQVDSEKATFSATWHSGKYGNSGTLKGSFSNPYEGRYEAFIDRTSKVHDAIIRRER